MKIVLTGCTGFVGTEVLEQCIAHNYISHIYCLTRHQIDFKYAKHPKVTQIIHESFESYPEHILNKLRDGGVEGCIWCLGGTIDKFPNLEEARKVGIHLPIVAAETFAGYLAPALSPSNQRGPRSNWQKFPFRFVFISAWGAEQDQLRTLWLWNDSRKIKGAAEKGLFTVAEGSREVEGQRCFDVFALRAGTVIPKGDAIATLLREGATASIAVDRLAKCAIRTSLEGAGNKILENRDCLGDDWAQVNTLTI